MGLLGKFRSDASSSGERQFRVMAWLSDFFSRLLDKSHRRELVLLVSVILAFSFLMYLMVFFLIVGVMLFVL